MFGLKTLNLKKRLLGYIVTWQLLALILGGGFGTSLPTAHAQENYSPGYVYSLAINPADNSAWVFWNEGSSYTFVISHFDATGKQLDIFRFPSNIQADHKILGVDFTPDAPRLYDQSRGGINAYNLKTGTVKQLISNSAFQDCNMGEGWLGYSAATKYLYVGCVPKIIDNYGHAETYYYVVEAATGKILKKLDKGIIPLGEQPGTTNLYAQKEYFTYNEYKQPKELYDIVVLDGKTGQPTTDAPIAEKLSIHEDKLGFFDVNAKTGDVYFSTRCCTGKSSTSTLSTYYAQQAKLKRFNFPQKNVFPILLNEAANQLYLESYYSSNGYVKEVYSLSNLEGTRLANFDWRMLGADNLGMVYAASETLPGINKSPGLGLVVINPQTFSVIRTISLQAPDKFYQDLTARLSAPPAGFKGRFFPETGHTLEGKFLEYWEKNGGLARFGYPITEPFYITGDVLVHQYFERHRFELHPENAGSPYEVLLGTLGRNFSAFTGPRPEGPAASGETVPVAGGVLFKETGRRVTGKFYDYWKANGGLAQHGLPLTEPTEELNPIDGKLYTVQYFERSRLELHPENAGTQYEVLMGHFGIQYLRAQGWNL